MIAMNSGSDSDTSWLNGLGMPSEYKPESVKVNDCCTDNDESWLISLGTNNKRAYQQTSPGHTDSVPPDPSHTNDNRKKQRRINKDFKSYDRRIGKLRGSYIKSNQDTHFGIGPVTDEDSDHDALADQVATVLHPSAAIDEQTKRSSTSGTRKAQLSRSQKVAAKFKDNLSFLTYACCPFAGPQHLFKSIDDFSKSNRRALIYNGVRKDNHVEELLSKSSEQTNAYAFELERSFTGFGLLKGLQYLCKRCRDGLSGSCPESDQPVDVASMFGDVASSGTKGIGSKSGDDEDADEEREMIVDDENDPGECGDSDRDPELQVEHPSTTKKRGKGSLKNSYLNGLFLGTVPECLKCLTSIELSMIARINTVTKVRLVGTSHYIATTPTYSIINNVLVIAEQLPRMLSEMDHATLRTHKGQLIKDYFFRPSKVIAALRWLKENNWLYSKVEALLR